MIKEDKRKGDNMAKDKKDKKITSGDGFAIGDGGSFSLSIGAMLGREQKAEQKEVSAPRKEAAAPKTTQALSKLPKVSVQHRTAGCGGKTVTVVSIPKECAFDLEALAKDMRKALGCGSRVEEGKIVLQGDICDRAEAWFTKNGVKKVVRG